MNTLKKSVSVIIALLCVISVMSFAFTANAADVQKVKVIVKNTTFAKADGAAWDGVLLDEWINLDSGSTMQSVVENALEVNNIPFSFNSWGYLSSVNGLEEFASNGSGGWMMTLNDWFTTQAASYYSVNNDGLQNGDEVSVLYSLNWGADIGSLWGNSDTFLSSIEVTNGSLDREFDSSVTDYILFVESDNDGIYFVPEAFNKNYQVRVYKNEYLPENNGAEIKRSESIKVNDGDTIYIGVGNSSWPTMNEAAEETVYKLTVKFSAENSDRVIFDKFEDTAQRLLGGSAPSVGSVGGEWLALGLARAEKISPEFADEYRKNAVEYIKNIGSNKLHRSKSTDNSRLIAALSSIGTDATDFEGYDLVEPLNDFDYVKKQGVNGPIWALIAVDSLNYEIPEDSETANPASREKLVEYILENQTEQGGWSLSNSVPDADLTGMAITALAPYYGTNAGVKPAVDNALEVMSSLQNQTGGFDAFGAQTPEGSAQMVVALCSLGINPNKDARFIKNGSSLIDNMLSFSVDGGFRHEANGEYNQMSTEQCFYALAAYKRLTENKNRLYDMSDVYYDFNSDYRIDINDAAVLQRYIALIEAFTERQAAHSDINSDGVVTVSDVTSLQRYIAGIPR